MITPHRFNRTDAAEVARFVGNHPSDIDALLDMIEAFADADIADASDKTSPRTLRNYLTGRAFGYHHAAVLLRRVMQS